MSNKGILIIALGHPYYGRMALTLAASLRYTSKLPITLAHDNSAISQISQHLNHFDSLVVVPEKYYHRKGGREYIKAKTYLDKLSPYEETIYLDADMVWLPKRPIDLLFEELKDESLVIQCRGTVDLTQNHLPDKASFWCDLNEYKKEYGGERFYSLSSEFIYFKKTKEVKKFFTDSSKIYDSLKVRHTVFAGGVPDELVFNISMLQNGIENRTFYTPIYWEQAERKNLQPSEMHQKYFAYSAGGKVYSNVEKKFYDNLSQFYGTHTGVHYFTLKDKMKYLPERANI